MKKSVKAWYVHLPHSIFANCKHARIYETKERAQQRWPDEEIIPCTITFDIKDKKK